jgi:hypothetical protein
VQAGEFTFRASNLFLGRDSKVIDAAGAIQHGQLLLEIA